VIGTPLGAQGVVFVCVSGYGGYTYAFNARDGSLRWLRKTDCEVVSIPFVDYALPIEADGVLYTGAYALDAQDGKMLWRLPMEESFGAVVNGVIYAYSQGAVYAFDAKDRSLRWSYTLDDTIGNVPTVADGSVYVGDINGNGPSGMTPGLPDTYALDAATGALRWRYESGMVGGSAVVANGVVYISGFPCALYALDAARGKLRWRYQADTCSSSTPIVINGVVYFTADGAYAFDASDGTVRWHTGLGANQGNRFTSPTVMNGALYLGKIDGSGYSTLYALDASTGAELWHEEGINQLSPSQAGD
jgi:outer membrane protein assembly factor BamB